MGGQQFRSGATLVDTTGLGRVLSADGERGLVEVEAGICWPALDDALATTPWSVRRLQVGAGAVSVGGAVSSNAHGAAVAVPPIVADVERLGLVGPDGELRICSRGDDPTLFGLVVGGYGLLGAIATVTLRLAERLPLGRMSDVVEADELVARLEGCLYGEVELDCDAASSGFLRRGALSAYRPAADAGSSGGPQERSGRAAHVWPGSSVMLTELVVPKQALAAFLAASARELRERGAGVVRCTVRLAERDDETMLAWARQSCACVEIGLHVEHDAVAVGRAVDAFRTLVDVALAHGGTYSLTHHRWARRDQLERAHPRILEFIRAKCEHDPEGVFQSDWYAHLCRLLEASEAA